MLIDDSLSVLQLRKDLFFMLSDMKIDWLVC